MSSILIKIIYLITSAILGVSSFKYKKIKNKKYLIPLLCIAMTHCFGFWGIATIFNSLEGYPPQWFFYFTSTPIFLVSLLLVFNIEK